MRKVPHQITLIAFGACDNKGLTDVVDIVETSYKNASKFTRKWMKDEKVLSIVAENPQTKNSLRHDIDRRSDFPLFQCDGLKRTIKRKIFSIATEGGDDDIRLLELRKWHGISRAYDSVYDLNRLWAVRATRASVGVEKHENRHGVGLWIGSTDYNDEQRQMGLSAL